MTGDRLSLLRLAPAAASSEAAVGPSGPQPNTPKRRVYHHNTGNTPGAREAHRIEKEAAVPRHNEPGPIIRAAYQYINERDWTIVGVNADKKPAGKWKVGEKNRYDYTNAENLWAENWPGIGVVTGPSGLVCIDFDTEAAIRAWADKYGIPDTLTARSPRGRHLYYEAPPGHKLSPSTKLVEGVDVRADESYIILPPSRMNGGQYSWTNTKDIAPLPHHILELIKQKKATGDRGLPGDEEEIPEGQRNDKLFNVALRLWRAGMSPAVVKAGVYEHARTYAHGSIDTTELDSIIRSAKEHHKRNPTGKSGDETPGTINLTSFDKMPAPEPVDWLRGTTGSGRFPLGEMSMIYGEPGVGKGSITMAIIAEVTNAGGRVLLSTPEDDTIRVVKPRLMAAGADLSLVSHLTIRRGDDEQTVDIGREADKIVDSAVDFGAELIVIDPVSEHFGANVKDERANREQLAPFMRACREHQIAVIAIGHTNRMTGGSGYMRAGGSSALFKIARSAFIVGRIPTADEDQDTVKKHVALIHDKTNLGRAMPGIVYDIRTEELSIVDGKPITTSLAVNIGETHLSSDDILDERKIAEQRKVGECAVWLERRLDECLGLSSKNETENEARKVDNAWTTATVRAAAKIIGAKCAPGGSGAPWVYTAKDYEPESEAF